MEEEKVKKGRLDSRYRELSLLLKQTAACRKAKKVPLIAILGEAEEKAVKAYLRCRSYNSAARKLSVKAITVYLRISRAVACLRLWKQLDRK